MISWQASTSAELQWQIQRGPRWCLGVMETLIEEQRNVASSVNLGARPEASQIGGVCGWIRQERNMTLVSLE